MAVAACLTDRLPGQGGVKPEFREDAGLPAVSSASAGPVRGLRRPLSPTAAPPPAKRQAAAALDSQKLEKTRRPPSAEF